MILFALGCALTLSACGNDLLGNMSGENVAGAHFHEYIIRDLRAYFKLETTSPKSIACEYIKNYEGVYQSGMGFPHYFLWATVYKGNKILSEYFIEMDAIDTSHFEVKTIISKEQIKKQKDLPPPDYAFIWPDLVRKAYKD